MLSINAMLSQILIKRIKSSHGFLNTLLFEQNGPHFADNIFKYLFWIKNVCIFHQISLKFDYRDPVGNIIGPLFTHFGLVSCLCLSQWPLAFLMTPLDWTMSCHVLIMYDGSGWKHHRVTYKLLCRMGNFSGMYFNYTDISYIHINKKELTFFYMSQWKMSF